MVLGAFTDQPAVVGDTLLFEIVARKNDETWDITGGSATLYIYHPTNGWLAGFAGNLTSPTEGIAQYQNASDLLDTEGTWKFQWKVVAGGVTLWTRPEEFEVYEAAVAAA